jgi:hypothetical protein
MFGDTVNMLLLVIAVLEENQCLHAVGIGFKAVASSGE